MSVIDSNVIETCYFATFVVIAPLFGSCRLNISIVLMLGSFVAFLMTNSLSFAIVCVNQNNRNNSSSNSNLTNCTDNEQQEHQSCGLLV